MWDVSPTAIPDVKVLIPSRHYDERGFFSETYNKQAFAEAGLGMEFVQDNHSFSKDCFVVRGLHYQAAPCAQDKLVRVTRGSALDVAVDLRRGSPTFKQYVSAVLSAENWQQLFIPRGFAHGFCTLEPNTEVAYKVSEFYRAELDRGILWNDAQIGIPWPVGLEQAVLSEKDRRLPRFSEALELFTY